MTTPRIRAGFTLVEMMVVIVILGVVVGVTVPALRGQGASDPLDAATSAASTLLGRARRTAVERATTVRLSIDPVSHRYRVRALAYGAAPDSVASDSLALPTDVRLDAPPGRMLVLHFAPTGEARGDTLVLRWQGRTGAVSADQWTGEAHVAGR